jgi:hypothetical protein
MFRAVFLTGIHLLLFDMIHMKIRQNGISIGGNQISERSLDLNRPFAEIADSLDRIVYESFGNMLKRSA